MRRTVIISMERMLLLERRAAHVPTGSHRNVRVLIVLFWIARATTYAQDVPNALPADEAAESAVTEAPAWTATVGGGLALASGNTDSLSYNLAVEMAYGSKTGNMLKWTGLYLRGTQNDVLAVNRLSMGIRNEYTFSPRVFAFGRIEYLHDTFKRIDYFAAPAVGIGYNIVDTPRTRVSVDLGGGSVTERNLDNSATTTGAVQAGEAIQHQLTPTAALKHAITAVWNTNDVGNGLYTGSLGIATQISSRLQLSVDLLDTYRTRPPTAATDRNDINLVVAITAKY